MAPKAKATDPAAFKSLLADRNRKWMPTLVEHRTFVAVGAGYMASEEGLLRLLADAGLKTQRVGLGDATMPGGTVSADDVAPTNSIHAQGSSADSSPWKCFVDCAACPPSVEVCFLPSGGWGYYTNAVPPNP